MSRKEKYLSELCNYWRGVVIFIPHTYVILTQFLHLNQSEHCAPTAAKIKILTHSSESPPVSMHSEQQVVASSCLSGHAQAALPHWWGRADLTFPPLGNREADFYCPYTWLRAEGERAVYKWEKKSLIMQFRAQRSIHSSVPPHWIVLEENGGKKNWAHW